MICDSLLWSFNVLAGVPWLELIKAFAPVFTAVIAWSALRNWQRQDKAKREAEFLDTLIETTLAYVAEMPGPVTHLGLTMIGFHSREPIGDVAEKEIKGAIAYMGERGEEDSKRMLVAMNAIRPSVERLNALVAKGQVFRFEGYAACRHAASMLTWQFSRIEMFANIIGSQSWNWENPEVRSAIHKVISLDPKEVSEQLEHNKGIVLEFATAAYRRLYG